MRKRVSKSTIPKINNGKFSEFYFSSFLDFALLKGTRKLDITYQRL